MPFVSWDGAEPKNLRVLRIERGVRNDSPLNVCWLTCDPIFRVKDYEFRVECWDGCNVKYRTETVINSKGIELGFPVYIEDPVCTHRVSIRTVGPEYGDWSDFLEVPSGEETLPAPSNFRMSLYGGERECLLLGGLGYWVKFSWDAPVCEGNSRIEYEVVADGPGPNGPRMIARNVSSEVSKQFIALVDFPMYAKVRCLNPLSPFGPTMKITEPHVRKHAWPMMKAEDSPVILRT